ncbi:MULTISPECIES: Rid family hydrolase [Streptomyces]|uniref:Rid family hydrolase n=1 Tax=Streptomyces TaxID=1883 RepID=UPI00369BDF7C
MGAQAVNPVTWSVEMGFNQGEIVSGHTRTPVLLRADLEAVLGEAGMSLAHLVRLDVYTTDVDLLFPHYGVLASRWGAAGVAPATTMLGVTRLAIPGQMVELEGTAVA